MTRRLFVCHANADIEATSEVVDALENALSFRAGSLWTSGLPGYATDAHDPMALRGALAGSDMVVAIVTQASVHDPQFVFQLGAAWALGVYIVVYVLDADALAQLPLELAGACVIYGQESEQWSGLIGDISLRLGLVPRPAASAAPSIAPSHPPPAPSMAPATVAQRASTTPTSAPAATPTAPAPQLQPPTAAEPATTEATLSSGATAASAQSQSAAPQPAPRVATPGERPYLDELRAIGEQGHTATEERTPPRHSYIDDLRATAQDDDSAQQELDEEPETGEQPRVAPEAHNEAALTGSEPELDSDVFACLPTCEMALEAGRAVSDCVFNRAEIDDFATELNEPLGRLVESLGGSWNELRSEQDLDAWVAVTDQLLQTLPAEVRKVEEWYRVGFELATLHNLAGQLVLDGADAAAEQHWRGALERFLMRAERAEIGYENLGRVLGLLENLAGPSHERDLANIPRSLEELRRYAAGADIHSAA